VWPMRLAAMMLGGLAVLAACRAAPSPDPARERQPDAAKSSSVAAAPPPASSAPPKAPEPVAEAPVAAESAEAAARIVRTYFELIEAGRHAEAGRLWEGGGEAEFAAGLDRYRDYHAEVGPSGRMEGAAGSSYVAVPVRLHGRLKDGTPLRRRIEVTLRRVNDVPGSTEDQRRWRIRDIAVPPRAE
jgi:hypothetical protein